MIETRNEVDNSEISYSASLTNNNLWSMFRAEYIDPFMQSPYKSEIIFGVSLFGALFILSKVLK